MYIFQFSAMFELFDHLINLKIMLFQSFEWIELKNFIDSSQNESDKLHFTLFNYMNSFRFMITW